MPKGSWLVSDVRETMGQGRLDLALSISHWTPTTETHSLLGCLCVDPQPVSQKCFPATWLVVLDLESVCEVPQGHMDVLRKFRSDARTRQIDESVQRG